MHNEYVLVCMSMRMSTTLRLTTPTFSLGSHSQPYQMTEAGGWSSRWVGGDDGGERGRRRLVAIVAQLAVGGKKSETDFAAAFRFLQYGKGGMLKATRGGGKDWE